MCSFLIASCKTAGCTLQATSIERLTTGPGYDTQLAISTDGRKLAFTGETQHIQAWLFPFNASNGRIAGEGAAVTSAGTEAWLPNLSRDGKKLAFCGIRAGKWELWERSLVSGREAPIIGDDHTRNFPLWSPDGTRLAYSRDEKGKHQLMVWSSQSHNEESLTTPSTAQKIVYDWSPDSKFLLVSQGTNDDHPMEVWLLTVADAPHAEASARKIISDTLILKRAEWVLSGVSRNEIGTRTRRAYDSREFPMPAVGAMAYMMSPYQHLSDADPHWLPHLMFYYDRSLPAAAWGAGGMTAPVIDGSAGDPQSPVLVLFVPVRQWSDGTPAVGRKSHP